MKKQLKEASPFTKKVITLILQIPEGKVATYGLIASLSGSPQGSRGVSWILNSSSKAYNLPWHRVINAQGKISFQLNSSHFKKQRQLLKSEGIEVTGFGEVNLAEYLWKKKLPVKVRSSKAPKMFSND